MLGMISCFLSSTKQERKFLSLARTNYSKPLSEVLQDERLAWGVGPVAIAQLLPVAICFEGLCHGLKAAKGARRHEFTSQTLTLQISFPALRGDSRVLLARRGLKEGGKRGGAFEP